MPTTSASTIARALAGVDQALDAPRRAGIPLGNWRWVLRQRIATLREALVTESGTADGGWLAARGGVAFGERNQLLTRLGAMSQEVLDQPDVEQTRTEVKRLLVDVHHHLQRVNGHAADEPASGPGTAG